MFLMCESDCGHHLDDPATDPWRRPPGLKQLHHLRRRLPTGRVMVASPWNVLCEAPTLEQGSTLEDTLIHLQENRDAREDFFWFLLNHRPEFFKDSNTELVLMVGGYRCHLDWDQRYLSCRSLMLTDIPGYYERMVSFSQRYSQPSPLTLPTHILVSEPAAAKHKYQWFSRPQPVG